MHYIDKTKRERLSPNEFNEKMDSIPLTDEQFRDLFNRNSLEINGYRTGKKKNGSPHTPPTVSEMLVMDFLDEYPEMIEEMLDIALSREIPE